MVEDRQPPEPAHPPHQVQVFHHVQRPKPAEGIEHLPPHEYGLIAVGQPQQPRPQVHARTDQPQQPTAGGDVQPKRPADTTGIGQSPPHRIQRAATQQRIGVQEQQDLTPVAAAAPALSCTALPRGAAITRSANGRARSTVPSVLPPSTTMICAPAQRRTRRSVRDTHACSFSVGTITEIVQLSETVLPPCCSLTQ